MTDSTDEFDLRSLVIGELETNASADHYIVAKGVEAKIPAERVWDVLRVCLPLYVRNVSFSWAQQSKPSFPETPGEKIAYRPSDPKICAKALGFLQRKRVALSMDGKEDGKFLVDCSPNEGRIAVQIRRQLAAATNTEADRIERLCDAGDLYRVHRLGDLPPEVIAEALR